MRLKHASLAALFGIFIILIMHSCKRKQTPVYQHSEYWEDALPQILADSLSHFFTDTLIRNESTALTIAEPLLVNVYGQKLINEEKPFKALRIGNYWIVDGTLPSEYSKGGTATIILRASDGKIIQLTHYK